LVFFVFDACFFSQRTSQRNLNTIRYSVCGYFTPHYSYTMTPLTSLVAALLLVFAVVRAATNEEAVAAGVLVLDDANFGTY
jgi:hypothetical protein